MRLVDDDGREVGVGSPGEILARGPDLFIGYVDPPLTPTAIDHDGWFATGDIGILDDDGYLTITDRKKDIIIRGGENISASEVEDLLAPGPGRARGRGGRGTRPALRRARMRVRPPRRPRPRARTAQVRAHLEASGLARQKWPEELRVLDEFPRTPSGKIQKHVLRSELRARTLLKK